MYKLLFFLLLISPQYSFSQTNDSTDIVIPPPPSASLSVEAEIVDFPKVESQFKGGPEAMQKYIVTNFEYPIEAIEKNIQGRVYLSFVIEKDGSITHISIERGVHSLLNEEARSLVRNMPKWTPAEDDYGNKIRSRVRLPINFTLTNDE